MCRLLTALLLLPAPAQAWHSAGHQDVAAIAWHAMTPRARRAAAALLLHHPDAEKWDKKRRKYQSALDPAEDRFIRASVWADNLRRKCHKGDDACGAIYHFAWHYEDLPINGTAPAPHPNIEDGLQAVVTQLGDRSLDPETRAEALAWLIHLAGDAHMPLHCATHVTPALPDGDHGGNLTYVQVDGKQMKLHAYWDGLPGDWRNPEEADAFAVEHRVKAEISPPAQWCPSARAYATEIYAEPAVLGPQVVERDRGVATTLLQTAGARLAGLLNRMLGGPIK